MLVEAEEYAIMHRKGSGAAGSTVLCHWVLNCSATPGWFTLLSLRFHWHYTPAWLGCLSVLLLSAVERWQVVSAAIQLLLSPLTFSFKPSKYWHIRCPKSPESRFWPELKSAFPHISNYCKECLFWIKLTCHFGFAISNICTGACVCKTFQTYTQNII